MPLQVLESKKKCTGTCAGCTARRAAEAALAAEAPDSVKTEEVAATSLENLDWLKARAGGRAA